jgi:hypothetical protein
MACRGETTISSLSRKWVKTAVPQCRHRQGFRGNEFNAMDKPRRLRRGSILTFHTDSFVMLPSLTVGVPSEIVYFR